MRGTSFRGQAASRAWSITMSSPAGFMSPEELAAVFVTVSNNIRGLNNENRVLGVILV